MRIKFARSGGIAGIRLAVSLDTETMSKADASGLRDLVESSGFFELNRHDMSTTPSPDRFQYQLEIEYEPWGKRSITIDEAATPEKLLRLLQHLTAIAKQSGAARQRT